MWVSFIKKKPNFEQKAMVLFSKTTSGSGLEQWSKHVSNRPPKPNCPTFSWVWNLFR